ncbi:MAG: phenylalanine--tRNA ligase subunit alpha [Dehalococcoidales bacterium]|jgi:phenylalanyl-tRNA synthetase alpha chain|nr:phenylalanine--tRNA ligase subunit alpha [Dehalococcoidales bacterium]
MDALEQLVELRVRALGELANIDDVRKLEFWRICYLGKKSQLSVALRSLGDLPLDDRKNVGAGTNRLRVELESSLEQKKQALHEAKLLSFIQNDDLDVSLPGYPFPVGRLHPVTQIIYEINDIFTSMGFQMVEGPEVEWDYYNFEALNIPKEHPARDSMATLWIDREKDSVQRQMLLRTHTSPMQIRFMERVKPPLRIVVPGKVYRYEATDATHISMFHQIEGLAVDRGITMADLKGTLYEFARRFFGEDRKVRFRCDYFPFVEPGVEMAIDCAVCKGKGCRLCGSSGWIEILGAGMVHPEVLKRVDIDPEIYTGFAFGMGIERIPMLRYGISDIRLFYGSDLRFLRQF